jgi:hypothetical protein
MELVEGQSLNEVIPSGGLAIDRLLSMAIALADALSAAHECPTDPHAADDEWRVCRSDSK